MSVRSLQEVAKKLGKGPVEVIVDRSILDRDARTRLIDSMEMSFNGGGGKASAFIISNGTGSSVTEHPFDWRFRCSRCDLDFLQPEPRLFSFNNPYGACPECKGFGNIIEIDLDKVVPD